PTEGFLFVGYAVAVILFFSVGAHVASVPRTAVVVAWGLAMGTAGVLRGPEQPVAVLGAWLVVVAPVVAGRLVAQQRAQTRRLHELTSQLERESALVKRSAVTEERARIARELHDVVGHEVTLIAIQSEAATSALKGAPERAVAPVEAIRQTAHRTGAEMRAILGVLRAEDGDVTPMPPYGPSGLADLVARTRQTGMDVTLTVSGAAWEDRPSVWLAVHRIVQEALTNAGRHAPGSPVTVTVIWSEAAVEVRVCNPAGGTANPPGLGILGMTERVRLLGGQLFVGLSGRGEFEVAVVLPAKDVRAP
ncbi:MAG: histidine kinase, partial [Actinomycetota bacterium]|nr:histidine kinase [Actinomycetota bacterium]